MADLKLLHDKFFTDPSWGDMEDLILEYIEPFRSVMTIDAKMSNDQIATEVRGRQLQIQQLDQFLKDTKIISRRITNPKPSYK